MTSTTSRKIAALAARITYRPRRRWAFLTASAAALPDHDVEWAEWCELYDSTPRR
jgi:hypothetical protein